MLARLSVAVVSQERKSKSRHCAPETNVTFRVGCVFILFKWGRETLAFCNGVLDNPNQVARRAGQNIKMIY